MCIFQSDTLHVNSCRAFDDIFISTWASVLLVLLSWWAMREPLVVETSNKSSTFFFMVHIGKLIKQELEAQERTPSWLARKISCERPNIYNIFERKSIDTNLLFQISKALNKDFFAILSQELNKP